MAAMLRQWSAAINFASCPERGCARHLAAVNRRFSYFFSIAGQFTTTLMGRADCCVSIGIRKRPSFATSNVSVRSGLVRGLNSTPGAPASKLSSGPLFTSTAMHRNEKILELKEALRSALWDVPAPSLVSLCNTLNTPEHALEKMCPRECASIRARYRYAREEASVRRKEQLQQEVRTIMQKLHGEGKYPTIKHVRILLRQRNNWAEVSTAVATVRKEFPGIILTPGRRDPT